MKIWQKVLLPPLIIAGFSVGGFTYFSMQSEAILSEFSSEVSQSTEAIYKVYESTINHHMNLVEEISFDPLLGPEPAALALIISRLKSYKSVKFAYFVDMNEHILANGEDPDNNPLIGKNIPDIHQIQESTAEHILKIENDYLIYSHPFNDQGEHIGRLQVHFSINEIKSIEKSLLAKVSAIAEEGRSKIGVTSTIIFILILLSLIFVILLSINITKPIPYIQSALSKLSSGQLSHRIKINTKDEIADMADALNSVLSQLQKILLSDCVNWGEVASQKKREQEAISNMKSILRGLDEGVFFFDQSGKIAPERSAVLKQIIPDSDDIYDVYKFFEKYGSLKNKEVKSTLDLLWGDTDQFVTDFISKTCLLPKTIKIAGRDKVIAFKYKELLNIDRKLEKIIVTILDVTETNRQKHEIDSQIERVNCISFCANNIQNYSYFKKDSEKIQREIDLLLGSKNYDEEVKAKTLKNLHTFKGDVSTFGFGKLTKMIHKMESSILNNSESINDIKNHWSSIKEIWLITNGDISEVLGLTKDQNHTKVNTMRLHKLQEALNDSPNLYHRELMISLMRFPSKQVFQTLSSSTERIAASLGKKIILSFPQDNMDLSYHELWSNNEALMHILRNIVDHGIEPAEERAKQNKPEAGIIIVKIKRPSETELQIVISDDGRGINTHALISKAVSLNLWTPQDAKVANHEQAVQLIFQPHLSTKNETTSLSGRGIGMDIVKESIESRGGKIKVSTIRGQGTTFEIYLPKVA